VTGNTKILIKNFSDLLNQCKKLISFKENDLVIDIGSNDGSLLKNFKDAGIKTLGIEPSQASKISKKNNIPTLVKYFNNETVEFIRNKYGKAKLITATNVFAHIEDPNKLVSLVKKLMDGKSIFVTESHYLVSLLKTVQYDTVYHEHLRYYHLNALKVLFERNNMEIINVKKIKTHGGSIRVFASKKGNFMIDKNVAEMIKAEKDYGLSDFKIYRNFKKKIVNSKFLLLKMMTDLKLRGKKIYGVGSPSRASTLINFVGLDENFIDCILEVKHSSKINKFMPGTRIPVVDEKFINKDSPDYLLLLSWHIADELIKVFKKKGYKGKFILPLPKPLIIS
tara:strand:- start:965 stop:1975 length:1011 start_codon:yes stop_codon:yes gene_type:complete